MTVVDPFVINLTPETIQDSSTLDYLNRFLHDLWFGLTNGTGIAGGRTVQIEVTADYTTTGRFDHEIVVCNNTSAITVTLQTLVEGQQVSVTRAGTGAVTIDGNGSTIIGESTQSLPDQYDVANMTATTVEWVLKS